MANPNKKRRKRTRRWKDPKKTKAFLRFYSTVVGKSHDPRDVDLRRRFDNEMAEDEATVRAGWGPGHIGC